MSGTSGRDTGTAAPRRVHAIDLLRLVMSLQMIQGHTIGALLLPELRAAPAFDAWTFFRGLTAVGFLFAAGTSYHQATSRERDAASAATGRARRSRRALWLIAIGYLLRPPVGLLAGTWDEALVSLDAFFAVDVLQCIGVTLLVLEGLRSAITSPRRGWVCAAIGIALIALAPAAAQIDAPRPLAWLTAWLSRAEGSLFPLLPWSGFVFLGVALGPAMDATRTLPGAARLIAFGLALAGLGLVLAQRLPGIAPERYYAWPPFSLLRLGLVVVLGGTLGALSVRLTALPAPLSALARQTLVLYVTHLLVIHASVIGLSAWIGETLSWPAAIGVAAANLALSVAVALAWDARSRAPTR